MFASDRSGAWEIWASDRDGTSAFQLTSLGTVAGAPSWSPDGQRIVFQASLNGQSDIYIIPAAGGKPRNLTELAALHIGDIDQYFVTQGAGGGPASPSPMLYSSRIYHKPFVGGRGVKSLG